MDYSTQFIFSSDINGFGVGIKKANTVNKLIFWGEEGDYVNAMEGKQNKNMQNFGKKIGNEQ